MDDPWKTRRVPSCALLSPTRRNKDGRSWRPFGRASTPSAGSSWNYLGHAGDHAEATVTYWMNALQQLPHATDLFVTLNPPARMRLAGEIHREIYDHPVFDGPAMAAQRSLWSLQGEGGVWFCGAYFGAGFHEDGLQAGLAVAEALGGVARPWRVPAGAPSRIHLSTPHPIGLAA